MILTTRTKVAVAATAYRATTALRRIVGKDDRAVVSRGGFRWSLDLGEGIDFSIYLLGGFEKATGRTLRRLVRHGATVFDIGANIGAHTLGLARSVGPEGRVFAFEPTDTAFAKLRCNLALNPSCEARTRAHQILLAAQAVEAAPGAVYASWPLQPADDVHPRHRGRLVAARGAVVDTLDGFVARERIRGVDLIKLDVDGNEAAVLSGGARMLSEFRPTLVMEIAPYVHTDPEGGLRELLDPLREAGYALEDAANGRPLPMAAGALASLIPDGAGINVIGRAGAR